jgi:hypothetical protein
MGKQVTEGIEIAKKKCSQGFGWKMNYLNGSAFIILIVFLLKALHSGIKPTTLH